MSKLFNLTRLCPIVQDVYPDSLHVAPNVLLTPFRNVENVRRRHISYMGGVSFENVGLLTSAITFSRRSSGATINNGMLRFGCIEIRSESRNNPE